MPGWPAFACCTMSIDSVLIVSMESCSISVFAKALLRVRSREGNGYTVVAAPALISSLSAASSSSDRPIATAAIVAPPCRNL